MCNKHVSEVFKSVWDLQCSCLSMDFPRSRKLSKNERLRDFDNFRYLLIIKLITRFEWRFWFDLRTRIYLILDAQFFLHKKLDLQDIRFERGINPGDPGFSCQKTDKGKLTQGSCFYCNVSDRVIFSDTKFWIAFKFGLQMYRNCE